MRPETKSRPNYFTDSAPQDRIADKLRTASGLSKWQLFNAICGNCMNPIFVTINGLVCAIQGIAKEDGSGRCFNLTVQHAGNTYPCFCKTID